MSKTIAGGLGVSGEVKDPLNNIYYTYSTNANRNKFQILGYLENNKTAFNTNLINLINTTYADTIDYTDRKITTYGTKLGILLDKTTNSPVSTSTPIDIVNTTDEYKAILSNDTDGSVVGTGVVLAFLKDGAGKTCNEILKNKGYNKGDGVYYINPTGTGSFQVYCDMTTDGGGWILVGRSVVGGTGDFGWNYSVGNPNNDSSIYSMGTNVKSINFSEIMVARYSNAKNIELAIKFGVDRNVLLNNSDTSSSTTGCKVVEDKGILESEKSWNHCQMFSYWGFINSSDSYWFIDVGNSSNFGLIKNKLNCYLYNSIYGAFTGKQGMIFIK